MIEIVPPSSSASVTREDLDFLCLQYEAQ